MKNHIKCGVTVKDLQGQKSKHGFYHGHGYTDAAWPATAIADAMTALKAYVVKFAPCTLGGVIELMVSEITGFANPTLTYAGEPYSYGYNKLVLPIRREDGGESQLHIPAPMNASFQPLTDIANMGAEVGTLVTALCTGSVCDASGNLYKTCKTGWLDTTGETDKNPGGL